MNRPGHFARYLWKGMLDDAVIKVLAFLAFALAIVAWAFPAGDRRVSVRLAFVAAAPLILLLLFLAIYRAGALALSEFLDGKDDKGLAGVYLKQGKPGAIATFKALPGLPGWYTVDGVDWQGAGVLDGPHYYGLYWYNTSTDSYGKWGVHFAKFDQLESKPFVFVGLDLHESPTRKSLDQLVQKCQQSYWKDPGCDEVYFWTKSGPVS